MTLLLDIAPFSPPATPRDTGRDIYRRFEDDPDLLAIAVVGSPAEVAAALRRRFARCERVALSTPYAVSVDALGELAALAR